MSEKNIDVEVSLIPSEGFTEETKTDGSKTFTCKQCDKDSICEKGIKMHIRSKHKKQPIKRTFMKDESSVDNDEDGKKKSKFDDIMVGPDMSEFHFDPMDMETSSQIDGEHLDRTTAICGDVLKDKAEDNKPYDDLDNTVQQILLARTKANTVEAPNLEATIIPDQDHNYLKDDPNDNTEREDILEEDDNSQKASILSMKIDIRDKENEINRLLEDNAKLREEGRQKDETNDALTARNNSLEESQKLSESNINSLNEIKLKYEARLKMYGATIKQMDYELNQPKAPKYTKEGSEEKQFEAVCKKLDKENKDLTDKFEKSKKQVNEKQKELKQLQAIVKKKEVSEKELQLAVTEKNGRISQLETAHSRLQIIYDHTKELNEKNFNTKAKANEQIREKKETKDDDKQSTTPNPLNKENTKCYYENNGTCREQEKCSKIHPKKTCQSFSKLGSCPQESVCEHRHPQKICLRLQSSGYCPTGDRCRNRHPLEYAYQDLSQCSSPRSPQDTGGMGSGTPATQTFSNNPTWTLPMAGVSQGGRHPNQQGLSGHLPHAQGSQHSHQGQRGQMW